MKLTVLGSGVLVPQAGHAPSCYFLEAGGKRLLFDAGSGSLQQLVRAGLDYRKIDAFFFSHLHPDHVHELPMFFVAAGLDKANKAKRFTVFGPKGIKRFFAKCLDLYPFMKRLPVKTRFRELADTSLRLGGVKVRSAIVQHTVGALAYRVEAGKKSFVFSGDSEDCLALRKLCWKADLAMLECSSPRKPFSGHLTALDCGALASACGVKHLVLSHLYPASVKADVKGIVGKRFKGKIRVARDFSVIPF